MRTDPAVAAWAKALFEIAQADDSVERVDTDLQTAVDTIRGHLKLKETLSDPALSAANKTALITELFADELAPPVTAAVIALAQEGKQDLLGQVREAYEAVSEEVRNVAIADVTTAVELTDEARSKLKTGLAKVAGKDVSVREHVDPEILGGVVVRMGGKVMDGSVRTKLAKLREQMVTSRSEA